jgi:hypothetical protein
MATNVIECHRCGDEITGWCETRRFGFWDADEQNHETTPVENRYCRECWDGDFGRANGAHFKPESAEQLYEILAAAGGDLTATLTWWSGKPSIRVVDGEVQAAVTKPKRGGETADGTPILNFECERIADYDKEQFLEDAEPGEMRDKVLLKDPSESSFAGLDDE